MPITEEVRKCTGQQTISAYVMYYSKKCTRLSGRGRLRERSLTKAFNYNFSNARFVTDSNFLSGFNYSESGLSVVEKRSVSQLKIKILPDSQLSLNPIHTLFNCQFKRGFTMLALTRTGRIGEWSKEELRLYLESALNLLRFFPKAEFLRVFALLKTILK